MKDVLSLAVVSVPLFIMVARAHDEAARQWAVGAIAFVLGYYFRETEAQSPQ
jgi:hypothetical protein